MNSKQNCASVFLASRFLPCGYQHCCIFHQIAFRQGAAILDAIRQRRPFCMAQQKMYSPQKWAHLKVNMLGAKLRSTCVITTKHNNNVYVSFVCTQIGRGLVMQRQRAYTVPNITKSLATIYQRPYCS